jgi:hypothetical protein
MPAVSEPSSLPVIAIIGSLAYALQVVKRGLEIKSAVEKRMSCGYDHWEEESADLDSLGG